MGKWLNMLFSKDTEVVSKYLKRCSYVTLICFCWGTFAENIKWYSYGKQYGCFTKINNIYITWSNNSWRDIYIYSNIIYNSPELGANKCLSVDEWINKLWYTHTHNGILFRLRKKFWHAITWVNFEDIILSKISQSQKNYCEQIYCIYTLIWTPLVAQIVKNLPAVQDTQVRSLGEEDPLEKGKTIHSSILA